MIAVFVVFVAMIAVFDFAAKIRFFVETARAFFAVFVTFVVSVFFVTTCTAVLDAFFRFQAAAAQFRAGVKSAFFAFFGIFLTTVIATCATTARAAKISGNFADLGFFFTLVVFLFFFFTAHKSDCQAHQYRKKLE